MLGQATHEELFRSHLAKHNTFVEFNSELISFEESKSEDLVTAKIKTSNGIEIVKAKYLVGADGASSVTRKQLQIPFLGTTEEELGMVTGDVYLDWKIEGNVSIFLLYVIVKTYTSDEEYPQMGCTRNKNVCSLGFTYIQTNSFFPFRIGSHLPPPPHPRKKESPHSS